MTRPHRPLLLCVLALAAAAAFVLCPWGCDNTEPKKSPAPQAPVLAPQPKEPPVLKLLTYNVLASEVGKETRIPALFKLLEQSDADVIALQEVAPWFLELLLREPWARANYHVTMERGRPLVAGGLLILSKRPIEKSASRRLPGRQGRYVLAATISVEGRTMVVAAVHLESPLEEGPIRAEQLDTAFDLLKGADDAILLGDFNFGNGEEPETQHLDGSFTDMWPALRPDEPGFTWDIEKSEMAAKGSFPGERSRRIDRILVRSKVWRPKSIIIIGDEPVRPGQRDLFPSDHFGLVGVLAGE